MPPSRFTVDLDADADARFKRLVDALGDAIGRVPSHRGQRYPSRADLLRALLAVAEDNQQMRDLVHAQVRATLTKETSR